MAKKHVVKKFVGGPFGQGPSVSELRRPKLRYATVYGPYRFQSKHYFLSEKDCINQGCSPEGSGGAAPLLNQWKLVRGMQPSFVC